MNIIMVRHAESQLNIYPDNYIYKCYDKESHLTDYGQIQAQLLANNMPDKWAPDIIYSSPIKRAADTADFFSLKYNKPVIYDERIEEMRTPVEFEYFITQEEWDMLLEKRVNNPYIEPIVGFESLRSQYQRTTDFLKEIILNHDFENIYVFTHAFTIEMAMVYFTNNSLENLQKSRFKVSNTGVFIVRYQDTKGYYLLTTNSQLHLNKL